MRLPVGSTWLVAVVLVAGGCAATPDVVATSARSAPPNVVDPLGAQEVLAIVRDSVAMISTPDWSGSAILVDDGFLVTNAHVVDPFDTVEVVFEGGEHHPGTPVVGIDPTSDIALIGPVDTDRPPLALRTQKPHDQGRTVFLVGYPGEMEQDPVVTISEGVVSRIREEPDWAHVYVQTDASIAGGQSGGPLLSDAGEVIGISGLSFTASFALALSAGDVAESVDAIREGRVDHVPLLASAGDTTTFTAQLSSWDDSETIGFPNRPGLRTVELRTDPDQLPSLYAYTLGGDLAQGSQPPPDPEWPEDVGTGLEDTLPEVRPGVFELVIPDGSYVLVDVGTWNEDGGAVKLDASEPFVVVPGDSVDEDVLDSDDERSGVLGLMNPRDSFRIELDAGQAVSLNASCPGAGDPLVVVESADGEPLAFFDDGGGGLYNLASTGVFRAESAGVYRIVVELSIEPSVTAYRLTVSGA